MTLQWTDIELPLGGGIDTKTNEKLLKPPAAADLSDAVFPASGIAGYETRKGYDRILTATTVSNIDTLAIRENELAVCGDDKLYSVSELANNIDLIEKGNLLAVKVEQETLDTQSINQTLGQIITHGGIQVHCWLDSGTSTIQYTVTDAITGAVISADNNIANALNAKLTKIGSAVLVVYYENSTAAIRATIIPTYAPTSTTDVEVRSDAEGTSTLGLFDLIEVSDTFDRTFVAYHRTDGETEDIAAFLLDDAGNATQVTTVSSVAMVGLAVGIRPTGFVVAITTATVTELNESTGGNLGTINAFAQTASDTLADAAVDKIAYVWANDAHHIWVSRPDLTVPTVKRDDTTTYFTHASAPTFATATSKLQHSSLASSAFTLNGDPYVHVAHETPLQSIFFLINGSTEVQAKCCVNVAEGRATAHLPRVVDGTWAPVYREHLQVDLNPDDSETAADVFSQTGLKKVTYDLTHRPKAVEYGRTAYIASGIFWAYDGRTLAEQGFHIYPEKILAAQTTQGSALTLLNSYSYRVYYEWTNARGERQRSTTATAVTFTLTGANDEITLAIPTLAHTGKGTAVSIVVYRTRGNPNLNGGAPFYRVSDPDPSSTGDNAWLANDPTTNTVSFVDNYTDAAILTKELDYLNSGERDNVAPKSAAIIGEAKNRVWLAGFEKESRVQFSKLNSRGRDQLEYHDSMILDVPEEDGPVTAFGSLNFHVLIFKANSCYAVSGEGPNNLGQGFFNLPQVVSLDVGCVDQRSVVNTPAGVMFKSNKGIWQVGQNLQVQYIGANVEIYNDQDITSATIIPAENHVVFLTSSGSTLVYNYLVQEWSRFTNHAGHDGVIWNGVYTYARVDGRIYRQGDTYADDGVHYTMRYVTAPIALRGIQGRQKIRYMRLLGTYYSPHDLRVGLRFDHEPGTADEGTWAPSGAISVDVYGADAYGSGAYGGDGSPVYQARFNFPRQSCQTVQLVIDTTNTSSAGRAMSIEAIQISVGHEEGSAQLEVARSFSATGASTT